MHENAHSPEQSRELAFMIIRQLQLATGAPKAALFQHSIDTNEEATLAFGEAEACSWRVRRPESRVCLAVIHSGDRGG